MHNSDKYVKINIYLSEINSCTVIMIQEIYIVNDFCAKMLVNIDILVIEDIIMNLFKQTVIIDSCANIKVFFIIMIKFISQIHHIIIVKKCIVIFSWSNLIIVIIKLNLFYDQNFLFKSDCHQADISVYVHIVDHVMTKIHVWNNSDVFLIISQKFYINNVVKYETEDCYLAIMKNTILAFIFCWQFICQKWI